MGGFPALMIQQPKSPIQQVGEVEQIKTAIQHQQMGEIELQNARRAQVEDATIRQIYQKNASDRTVSDVWGKTIQDAAATGKVGPATLLSLQTKNLALQTEIAKNDEQTNKNALDSGNLVAGAFDVVKKVPLEQRMEVAKNQLASLAARGINVASMSKMLGQLPDLSDDTINSLEAGLLGHNKMLENDLAMRKTAASEAEAAARTSQAATAAAKLPGELAQQPLTAQKTQAETAQMGQVTPKDVYVQNMENYRASLARQATNANAIGKQGLESLQKQSDAYTQFLGTANSLKNSLMAAGNGNEMAAAVAPLQGTLFITTSEGVKRINETELKGVSGAGSLVQRINGALGKLKGEGPLSASLKNDMAELVDLYENAKYDSYQKQAAYTQKLHGLDAKTTPILAKDGSITTAGAPQATPATGVIRARDPQGKLHEAPAGTALPAGWKLEK